MKKTYYHATDMKNLISVSEKGLLRGCDGIVYLTEKPEESLRFIFLRGYNNALVLEVELDEKDVVETFDHSYNFFKFYRLAYLLWTIFCTCVKACTSSHL